MKAALGLLFALVVGGPCWLASIPLSASPVPIGALLVVFTTLGFLGADLALAQLRSGG